MIQFSKGCPLALFFFIPRKSGCLFQSIFDDINIYIHASTQLTDHRVNRPNPTHGFLPAEDENPSADNETISEKNVPYFAQ